MEAKITAGNLLLNRYALHDFSSPLKRPQVSVMNVLTGTVYR
ncbi:hypothetical protein [uncultured Chryseobacterium sp.]|nr:hypothetical protein [uncultured Chryseobacterium sp.]